MKELDVGADGNVVPPDWYFKNRGSFTIRSRYFTSVARGKNPESNFPFTGLIFRPEDRDEEYEPQNPELDYNELVISEHGLDREHKFRIPEEAIEEKN